MSARLRNSAAWFATTATLLLPLAPATSLAQETLSNVQVSNGVISSSQTLNVVENDGLTEAIGQTQGNMMQGGNDSVDATLTSSQVLHGNTSATVEINGVNTGGEDISLGTPVYATTQAIGNYGSFVTNNGAFSANTNQMSDAASVSATTAISAPNNAIYGPDQTTGDASVEVNDTSYQVTNGRIDSHSVQSSTTAATANTSATVHYSPSPEVYTAEATQNYYGSFSDSVGSQAHDVTQTAAGDTTARAELYGGNVWNSTVSGTAIGNNTNIVNEGGSLDVTNLQNQVGDVHAQGYTSADQYSIADVSASGIGNSLIAGNNDVTLNLDNTQVSSGGVEVEATFAGNAGYDGYVSANAVGNQAVAYACSQCQANMGVTNSQTNNSNVSAVATGTVNTGRSIVSSATATGNSANFYVSR
jgi:hypothetical protein